MRRLRTQTAAAPERFPHTRKEKQKAGLAQAIWQWLTRMLRRQRDPKLSINEPIPDQACAAAAGPEKFDLSNAGDPVSGELIGPPEVPSDEPPTQPAQNFSADPHPREDTEPGHDLPNTENNSDGGIECPSQEAASILVPICWNVSDKCESKPDIDLSTLQHSTGLAPADTVRREDAPEQSAQLREATEHARVDLTTTPAPADSQAALPWTIVPETSKTAVGESDAALLDTATIGDGRLELDPSLTNGGRPAEISADAEAAEAISTQNSTENTLTLPENTEPRPAGRYRPRLRQAARPPTPTRTAPLVSEQEAPAPAMLDAELVLTFKPGGWGIGLGILLRRKQGMAEEIAVRISAGIHDLCAIADDLFEPIPIVDSALTLDRGIAAEAQGAAPVRWVRTRRALHTFTGRAGVSGFVSVPRVIIGQENAVLCASELAGSVLQVCSETGSPQPVEVTGPGIPEGWRCFRRIQPKSVVDPRDRDEALLALVPLPDAAIDLSGGISTDRSTWLCGYPPLIRILGTLAGPGEMTIDGEPAQCSEAGTWTSLGWDRCGQHIIRFAGISRTYGITQAPERWESWEAHIGNGYAVCGSLVSARDGRVAYAASGNPVWLIGRVPGQVAQASRSSAGAPALASPSFDPIWAIPIDADRGRRRRPQLIGSLAAPAKGGARMPDNAIRRWSSIIRAASGATKDWRNSEPETVALWQLYRGTARSLRKRRSQ